MSFLDTLGYVMCVIIENTVCRVWGHNARMASDPALGYDYCVRCGTTLDST